MSTRYILVQSWNFKYKILGWSVSHYKHWWKQVPLLPGIRWIYNTSDGRLGSVGFLGYFGGCSASWLSEEREFASIWIVLLQQQVDIKWMFRENSQSYAGGDVARYSSTASPGWQISTQRLIRSDDPLYRGWKSWKFSGKHEQYEMPRNMERYGSSIADVAVVCNDMLSSPRGQFHTQLRGWAHNGLVGGQWLALPGFQEVIQRENPKCYTWYIEQATKRPWNDKYPQTQNFIRTVLLRDEWFWRTIIMVRILSMLSAASFR